MLLALLAFLNLQSVYFNGNFTEVMVLFLGRGQDWKIRYKMSELIITATIVRQAPSRRLSGIKFINSSRCIFCYGNERLSVLIYNFEGGEIAVGDERRCEIAFLTGNAIADSILAGDRFELALANEVVARGRVAEVLCRPT